MAQANLSAPVTLDPTQATTLQLRQVLFDYTSNQLRLNYVYLDAGGNVVNTREVIATDAAAQTYMANQASNILTRLLAKLGLTGTIV